MKEKRNLHLKVQELCDCFAATDPLAEMAGLTRDSDKDEAALKWLALAVLHGINDGAEKISLTRAADGSVSVIARYRDSELPSPGPEIGDRVLQAVRGITHLDEEKGKTILAMGIRDSSVDLKVKTKRGEGVESVTIEFP